MMSCMYNYYYVLSDQSGSEVLPHHSSSRPIMGSVGSSSSTVTSAGPAFSGDTGNTKNSTTTYSICVTSY